MFVASIGQLFFIMFSFGVDYATAMCKKLLDSDKVHGLHMYTLNLEIATIQILKNLGTLQQLNSFASQFVLKVKAGKKRKL